MSVKKSKNLAAAYKKKIKKQHLFPRDLPSLGIYSSANDMAILLKSFNAILQKDTGIIKTKQLQKMMRIQNIHVALDLGKKVGLSWMISGIGVENAGPNIWRAGASLYHRSRVVLLPDKQLSVVVMANDSRAWEVAEKVAEGALKIALEALYGIEQSDKEKASQKPVEPYGIDDQFAEYYSSFVGFIPVEKGEHNIKAELLGWSIIAKPDGKGWYDLQYDLFGFIPIDITWIAEVKIKPAKINDRRVIIVLYKGTQHLFASHIELNPPGDAWKARVGKYEIVNPDSLTEVMDVEEGELVVENNKLFFLYELPIFVGLELKVPLKIINDEMVLIPGLGTALNEVVTIKKQDDKELLEFSGYLIGKKRKRSFF